VNQGGVPDVRGPANSGLGAPFGQMAQRDGLRDPSYDDPRFQQDEHGPDEMMKHFESRKNQPATSSDDTKPSTKPIDPFVAVNSVPKGAKFDPIAPAGVMPGMPGFVGPSGDLSRFGDEAPPPEYSNMFM